MLKPFEEILPTLGAQLGELEELRQRLWKKHLMCWVIVAVLILIGAITALSLLNANRIVGFVAGGVCAVAAAVVFFWPLMGARNEYVARFKQEFVRPIAASVGLSYNPSGYIGSSYYAHCGLFSNPSPDRYHGEDMFEGRLGETDVAMCELHTEERYETTDSDGKTKTEYRTLFRGLFMWADFHKNFQGRTYVRPDVAEKLLGRFGRALQKVDITSKEQLIQLEDPEFEKAFVVNGSDQVEARFILSTSMMRRMLDLKNKFRSDVSFGFIDSSVYIAIPLNANLYEPKFRKSALDEASLRETYDQLASCFSIVEDLGLNVRIWGKR